MNNIKFRRPSILKRKRKLVRKDGRLKFTRRTKYLTDDKLGVKHIYGGRGGGESQKKYVGKTSNKVGMIFISYSCKND